MKKSKHTQTLCWECANVFFDRCPWHRKHPEPVPGWTAEKTTLYRQDVPGKRVGSYHVIKCPMFEPDVKAKAGVTEVVNATNS